MVGNIPGGNFLGENSPGGSLMGESPGGRSLMGGNFLGGSFPGGIFLQPNQSIQTKCEISSPLKLFHGAAFFYFHGTCVSRRFYWNLVSKSKNHLSWYELETCSTSWNQRERLEIAGATNV